MAKLFEKSTIKSMELKNRIIRSSTVDSMCDDGNPTEMHYKLFEKLAKGGTGLIITGMSYVSQDGRHLTPAMCLAIDKDEQIPKLKALTDHVHQYDTKIAMQIGHCGRQTSLKALGTMPMAPSPVKEKIGKDIPREMTEEDIERTIEAFSEAARRVKESGFDAVQINANHGYLVNQFLSPYTNRRKDKWGGTVENRMRFVIEIYKRCRVSVGEEFPVFIKMNAYDNMKNGLKLDEGVVMAQMMAEAGFDGIEVSCGIMEDGWSFLRGNFPVEIFIDDLGMFKNPIIAFIMRRFGRKLIKTPAFKVAFNRENAKLIKSKVDVPVFVVGGLSDPKVINDIIESGDADYVALSRPLIKNPSFPNRIKEGNDEPSKCISCNHCLPYLLMAPLRCYNGKSIRIRKDKKEE
ncbi:NADH-dependent flavin oxidoreductase [Candidatus Magnetomorum sp. HK-1]|nr:NADH-dependent flavin oxidoreductase [Candidatus Magnetomorum sp. HK-1]